MTLLFPEEVTLAPATLWVSSVGQVKRFVFPRGMLNCRGGVVAGLVLRSGPRAFFIPFGRVAGAVMLASVLR